MAEAATPRQVVDYARERFLMDAEFHARVQRGVQVVRETTTNLTDEQEELVFGALAVGLAMQWIDPMTGVILDG